MTHSSKFHQFIAVLIACWIPFCCCSVRAASAIVSGDTENAPASCCCSANSSEQTCDSTNDEEQEDQPKSACASCCVKVTPDAPSNWTPPLDELGHFGLETADIVCSASAIAHVTHHTRAGPTHPPPPPTLLQLHCKLTV